MVKFFKIEYLPENEDSPWLCTAYNNDNATLLENGCPVHEHGPTPEEALCACMSSLIEVTYYFPKS